ncbi:MAG: aldose 1-epimerase family protein [Abditibacteriota bacterium]|nr:aldose 1-epimerase family protein [Abditibacteriota bacterium]
MPVLFGKHYTKDELLAHVGDISQIGGVKEVRYEGGVCDGEKALEFATGTGLVFTAVASRGLDITAASYCGKSLCWHSWCGDRSPYFYVEPGMEWLRSFYGGLTVTCGMTNAGAPSVDEGKELGMHGRFSNTPASNVWADGKWVGDDYVFWAKGKIRETTVFGENLLCERTVSARLGENKIYLEDIVTNEGTKRTPHMMLYHINSGFPVVADGSLFISPSENPRPRDADAQVDAEHYYRNDAPDIDYRERCYYHNMKADENGYVKAAVVNPATAFGFSIKYKLSELPLFTQWKQNGSGEYVMGMEPANCLVEGRDKERQRGTLQFLDPGETRKYHIEFEVINTPQQIEALKKECNWMK